MSGQRTTDHDDLLLRAREAPSGHRARRRLRRRRREIVARDDEAERTERVGAVDAVSRDDLLETAQELVRLVSGEEHRRVCEVS